IGRRPAHSCQRDLETGEPLFKWLYRSPTGGSKTLLARSRQHAEDLARDFERSRPAAAIERGTFAELVDRFFRWKAGQGSAAAPTIAFNRRQLELHGLPLLSKKQTAAVTPSDISDMLERANLGPRSSNALATLVSSVFDFALEHDLVAANPVRRSCIVGR